MESLGGELSQKTSIPFRVFALLGQADDEASKSGHLPKGKWKAKGRRDEEEPERQ